MKISSRYDWLAEIDAPPKMVAEAIKIGKLDTTEMPGLKSNPEIMKFAKEAGVSKIYKTDEEAWCAVVHTAIALRAGKIVPFEGYDRLRARAFANFGSFELIPMFGDTLVFKRPGGWHVGIYIGEDATCFHVAGGNQSNQYSIIRIEKNRIFAIRRPEYKIGVPASVKPVYLNPIGAISKNEN